MQFVGALRLHVFVGWLVAVFVFSHCQARRRAYSVNPHTRPSKKGGPCSRHASLIERGPCPDHKGKPTFESDSSSHESPRASSWLQQAAGNAAARNAPLRRWRGLWSRSPWRRGGPREGSGANVSASTRHTTRGSDRRSSVPGVTEHAPATGPAQRAILSGLPVARTRLGRWLSERQYMLDFRRQELGDVFVAHLIQELSRVTTISPEETQGSPWEEEAVSGSFWPNNEAVKVVSEFTGLHRTLKRGRLLGRGGFGVVYLARDVERQEEVVLKIAIDYEKPTKQRLLELRREAFFYRALKNVKSSSDARRRLRLMVPSDVVSVVRRPSALEYDDSNIWIPNLFMVMPKAETDLARVFTKLLVRFPQLWTSDVAQMARLHVTWAIIKVVANMHRRGMVHADVKLSNFVVMRDGRVLLGDFGTCQPVSYFGELPCTEGYIPPERPRLAQPIVYSFAIDAWQLGIAIYRLWCSVRPSQNEDIRGEVRFEQCTTGPPLQVQTLVRRFLDMSPESRLLPLQAVRSDEFRQIREDVKRALAAGGQLLLDRSKAHSANEEGAPEGEPTDSVGHASIASSDGG